MPCYSPLQAYYTSQLNSTTGKRIIVFKPDYFTVEEVKLPCGQCIGCRLERSRQWAVRCMHEASLHEKNCFITLTYSTSNLPIDMSLDVREFQLFMKRLRKQFGNGIRFFHCGEYGDKFRRPHFHACIFGMDFSDKYFWKYSESKNHFSNSSDKIPLFRSPILEKLWPFGYSSIGDVTFDSAAYVARYITKKITGKLAFDYYIDKETGIMLKPEYTTMSRGSKSLGTGGIGKGWFDKFSKDVYPNDSVVVRGREMPPPKYYDRLYELEYPDDFQRLKEKRIAKVSLSDSTPERLAVRMKCVLAKFKDKIRNVDKEI